MLYAKYIINMLGDMSFLTICYTIVFYWYHKSFFYLVLEAKFSLVCKRVMLKPLLMS